MLTPLHRSAEYLVESDYRFTTDVHGRVDLIDARLRLEPSRRNQTMQVNTGGAALRTKAAIPSACA